jgi:N-ethylmaleimide reductase
MAAASTPTLLGQPLKLGDLELKNRIFMAPLTRMRAGPGFVPQKMNVDHYEQRASGGLIITEATLISTLGRGHPHTPGIYTPEQVEGWRQVVEAVHARGGRIFMQLWHVGRMSHSSIHPEDGLPIGPSPIAATTCQVWNADMVRVPLETPREMTKEDIDTLVEQYRHAASNALAAGFDGVELHGANGYILDQFLQDATNKRNDEYGGSFENRTRLLLRVLDAVLGVYPRTRVGVRLSPYSIFNEMGDTDPIGLFSYVIRQLDAREIAYVHLIEPRVAGGFEEMRDGTPCACDLFRPCFRGVLITAGGYRADTAEAALARGSADAVCFGRLFIANPDLPRRLLMGAPLNAYDRSTFYGGNEVGYTDYPFLPEDQQ